MKNLPSGRTIGSSAPLGGLVQVSNDAEAVFWDTSGVDDAYVGVTGSDFYYNGSSVFSLGSDCVVTYTGDDDIALIVTLVGSFQARGGDVNAMCYGIALNEDMIGEAIFGVNAYRNGMAFVQGTQGGALNRAQDNCMSQRRIALSSGDTFTPVAARSGGIGGLDLGINNLTMSWIQVAT